MATAGDGDGNEATRPADDSDQEASASDDQARARQRAIEADQHYGEAVRLFGEGRYREAIEEFDRAIELSDESVFFCNRGIALIKLNEWNAALDDMHACRQRFEGDDEELAQIDAQYRGLHAFVRGVRPHAVEVARDIASGGVSETGVAVDEPSPWTLELAGHLSLGTGSVLLTAAVMLDYLSADLKDEFVTQSNGGPGTSPQRHAELGDELETRQNVFAGLTISGAALAVTGVSILSYEWFFADNASDQTAAGSVSVAPSDDGAALQLRLEF
ncbi:MAG: hypothetical protein ACLFVJ_12225 [Persicimonas sp.]